MKFTTRIAHAWNAFRQRDGDYRNRYDRGIGYSYRPDHHFFNCCNERSIIAAIYSRIATDVSVTKVCHCMVSDTGQYLSEVHDGLDECLTTSANTDQTGRELIQNAVLNMLDDGYTAIIPIEAPADPEKKGMYDISVLRVGEILEWYPDDVRVRVYNKNHGILEEIVVPKSTTAIIENPFYSVMNDDNSVLRRLISKLNLIDSLDNDVGSNKLNLIIQLPYVIKSQARKQQAELRRKELEEQLESSQYGVAYTDGTEKVIQLNRSIENNYQTEVEYLTKTLYGQLGLSEEIMNGTATEGQWLMYYTRTIEPILMAITGEMKRKFLTKTARTQGHSIKYFRNPFKMMTASSFAATAEILTQNAILSPNEERAIMGFKPSDDPTADELVNRNINTKPSTTQNDGETEKEENA